MIWIIAWLFFGLCGLGIGLWITGVYNTIARLGRETDKNFANLESKLKQRHDELAKLVDACKGYLQHEATVLERVTELRRGFDAATGAEDKIAIENQLNATLNGLRVTLENYPELKASAHFLGLNKRISALETAINDRRELYNEAVTHFNVFISQIPAKLVADALSTADRTLLEISAVDKVDTLTPFTAA